MLFTESTLRELIKLFEAIKFELIKLFDWVNHSKQPLRGTLQKFYNNSTVRQIDEFQNGCYKKRKRAKFYEKQTFLMPWSAHVRVRIRGKKCLFFWKFGVLCFLVTPLLRFALWPYCRRIDTKYYCSKPIS